MASTLALFAFSPTAASAAVDGAMALAQDAPSLTVQVLGLTAFSVGLTLKRGATLDEATPSDILFEDVSDILTWRRPQDSPLYVLLRNLRNGERARATEVNWHEVGTIPRNTTKNGSSTSGSSGSSKTIDVNDDIYQVDDVLWLPDNANDAGAKLIVESVSAGSITVYRVDGGNSTSWGTVPAMADGEKIIRLGNSKSEFFERSPSRSTYPQEYSNFVQREDEVVSISRTKQATEDYAGDSWEQQRDNQVWDFQTSRESMLFFGEKAKKETTGGSGSFEDGARGFMGGINYYGPGNNLSYSASSFDTGKLLDMVRRTFVGDSGDDIRYLHADSLLIQDIMQLDDDLRQRPYESQQLRRRIPEIDMGFGQLRLIHENLFDEMGLSRYGFILDYSNIRLRELNPMKVKRLELEEKDGMAVQVKEEVTCEWRYLDTHAKISGSP
jgi:hypothetical protein